MLSGHNYRLEALQAAILNVKLKYLPEWTKLRRGNAAKYAELLGSCPGIELPKEHPSASAVYHLYVIQADDREKLREHLDTKGVSTGLHYPVPLHLQPAFKELGYREGSFPNAERSAKRIVSLPMYPELREEQIAYVAGCIRGFYGGGGR